MTKNIEDLLYRGDSLERMGELSGQLREDSQKYRKAAVRINWKLMIKQVRLNRNFPYFSQLTTLSVWTYCRYRAYHFCVPVLAIPFLNPSDPAVLEAIPPV